MSDSTVKLTPTIDEAFSNWENGIVQNKERRTNNE